MTQAKAEHPEANAPHNPRAALPFPGPLDLTDKLHTSQPSSDSAPSISTSSTEGGWGHCQRHDWPVAKTLNSLAELFAGGCSDPF